MNQPNLKQSSKEKTNVFQKKSQFKRFGIKNIAIIDGKMVISSFRKNDSNIESVTTIDGKKIPIQNQLIDSKRFRININRQALNFAKLPELDENYEINNPVLIKNANSNSEMISKDYLGQKDLLELEVFGNTHPNDNIRVQICYNIIDIYKILNEYSNSIVQTFNNFSTSIFSSSTKDSNNYNSILDGNRDIVGTISFKYKLDDQNSLKDLDLKNNYFLYLQKAHPYFKYFNEAFDTSKLTDKKYEVCCNNFDVLRLISMIRQIACHQKYKHYAFNLSSKDINKSMKNSQSSEKDELLIPKDLLKKLDDTYDKAIKQTNKGFMNFAGQDLTLLGLIYKPKDKKEYQSLIEKYYNNYLYKDSNNIGISIKKLRETIIDKYFIELRNKKYNSIRSRIYKLIDFYMTDYLTKETNIRLVDDMQESLRMLIDKDDANKAKIYEKYAAKLWPIINKDIENIAYQVFELLVNKPIQSNRKILENEYLKQQLGIKNNNELQNLFDDVMKTTDKLLNIKEKQSVGKINAQYFCKLIYFMTQFLDGKEINMLVTSLINKFDNIAGLLKTARDCDAMIDFSKNYKMFNYCKTISNSLRITQNIGKRKKELETTSISLFYDALCVLGFKGDLYEKNTDSQLGYATEFYKIKEKLFGDISDKKHDHKVRNFIINNVLINNRFLYIVKYGNPKHCPLFMQNRNLLRFLLGKMERNFLDRYYRTIMPDSKNVNLINNEEIIDLLIEKLVKFSYNNLFEEIVKMDKKSYASQENVEKNKLKSLISLYLLLNYQIIKGINSVNTQYSKACFMLEKDNAILMPDNLNKYNEMINCLALTEQKLQQSELKLNDREYSFDGILYKKHDFNYIKANYEEYKIFNTQFETKNKISLYREYRNNIQHHNVMASLPYEIADMQQIKSYYGIFNYALQKKLLANLKDTKFFSNINQYKTYSNDFCWIINIPFAYNLARYKNLSNENIYNDEVYK